MRRIHWRTRRLLVWIALGAEFDREHGRWLVPSFAMLEEGNPPRPCEREMHSSNFDAYWVRP